MRATRSMLGALAFGLLAGPVALSLSACADDQDAQDASAATTPAVPHPKVPIQSFSPEMTAEPAQPASAAAPGGTGSGQEASVGSPTGSARGGAAPQLENDPSAALDTPLCGTALREAASAGEAVYPDGVASGSTCARNACFEPLTGTFIAATGARSVCR